jgi:hypothetical protein
VSGFILEGRKAGLFTMVKESKNVFFLNFQLWSFGTDHELDARHTMVRKCSVAASSAMTDAWVLPCSKRRSTVCCHHITQVSCHVQYLDH